MRFASILFAVLVTTLFGAVYGQVIQEEYPENLFHVPSVNGFPDETYINDNQEQLRQKLIDHPKFFDASKCPNKCGAGEDYQQVHDGTYVSCTCVSKPDEMFEGDIKLSRMSKPFINAAYDLPQSDNSMIARGLIKNFDLFWPPTGKFVYIPYILSDDLTTGHRTAIGAAIAEYNARTCIRFIQRTVEPDYIHILKASGCWSMIGRNGGRQEMSLGQGCAHKGVVEHEMMHALGFFHEQSRPDRDNYVFIDMSRIQSDRQRNFEKQAQSNIDSMGVPYDLGSVMHYNERAFSMDGEKTIIVRSNPKNIEIGQRKGFSELDIEQINNRYCPSGVIASTTPPPRTSWTTRRTTTTPRTTTLPTTTTPRYTAAPVTGCRNTDGDEACDYWKSLDYCKTEFVGYMKEHCKASCGLCDDGSASKVCRNEIETYKCVAFKMYCDHENYGGWMRKYCAKQCGVCASAEVITKTMKRTTTTPVAVEVTSEECGRPRIFDSAYSTFARIVGGDEARPGTIPWQISIRFGPTLSAVCGGSLIGKEWILTAAHCVKERYMKYYSAYLGLHEKKPLSKSGNHKLVTFTQIIRHEGYNRFTMENDIALLRIKENVDYTNYILPVCLATSEPLPLTEVTVSGFGDASSSEKGAPVQDEAKFLMKVVLPLQKNGVCNDWMGGDRVKGNMICAGYSVGQKDSCQGDSGGPLTYQRPYDQKYYQIGVVSWGSGCAEKKKPGVYTKVSAYRGWIKSMTGI